jgi:serine/threonine-protein kinase
LRHPNIVPIYDSGNVDDQHYIVAHFVRGQTLGKRNEGNPPDFRQVAEWVRQLAEALAYAHGEGVVHRDIKPANIMLDEKGVLQIMDFGLAKRLHDDSSHTADGPFWAPAYMSPEQAKGKLAEVGPHSDQYSLGVVFYELLTGKKPFDGPSYSVIAQVITVNPPRPSSLRPDIPAELEAICLKAIAKQPGDRFPTTAEMRGALAAFLAQNATGQSAKSVNQSQGREVSKARLCCRGSYDRGGL